MELERLQRTYLYLYLIQSLTAYLCRRLFAKEGYSVALIARGANEVQSLADEINASGGTVRHLSFDLSLQF